MELNIRPAEECKYDAVSLGEIMLRLDPGEGRIRTARSFRAAESIMLSADFISALALELLLSPHLRITKSEDL